MTDFEKKLFDPPKKYRPAPFWSWNEKLNVAETQDQIRQMDKAGLGGFFMHARGGLQTGYLSDEWFENVSASLETGEETGMLAWGYDENGWPSGFGGGAVNGLGLEFQQKFLRCAEMQTPVTDEHTLSNVRFGDKYYHCYYEVNPFYVDTMNPNVIGEFLKSTHEKYRAHLKDGFRKMQGFFTDEPQASRRGVPWSFHLEEEYERMYGEPIREHLPKLFYRVEGYETFRFRFWRLVRDLFTDSFMGVIGTWCKENGSHLTGHMVLEEDYYEHILANGCCMPSYEFMDIPGMDHIGRVMPSVQTEMQLSSAAHQLGKKQILSETFAACGWHVSFEDLRKIYEHQMVHGVNLLCQHLEGYSLRGIRKRDYPASLFRHQPWWKEDKLFNDTVSRIGMLLAEGEVRFSLLVLHTIESGWLVTDDRTETDKYAKKLLGVMNALEDAQLQYHLGESRLIERHGRVENGTFRVGTQSYSAVIVPPAKCLDENTFRMLRQFAKQGGTVLFTEEIPTYLNGVKTNEVIEFAKDHFLTGAEFIAAHIPERCRYLSLKTEDEAQKGQIRTTVRHFDEQGLTMVYLCHFGGEEATLTLTVKGKSAGMFDAVSGQITPACFEKRGEYLDLHTQVPAGGSVIFFVYEHEEIEPAKPEISHKGDPISEKLKGEWKVSAADSNAFTLDFCDVWVNGEKIGENIPVSEVQETLCAYGKAVDAKIVFPFFVKELAFSACRLLLETPEMFEVFVNGQKAEKKILGYSHDPCLQSMDIYRYLREGRNEICLSCRFEQSEAVYQMLEDIKFFESVRNRLTYDMEVEAVYLEGDFGVFAEEPFEQIGRNAVKTKGGFSLAKAPATVLDGAIETQGYPFFAGSMTLSKTVTLSPDEAKGAVIQFAQLPSIVAAVSVNGKEAGKLMWRPYETDITDLVKPGENEICVTLTGSLRNLLGPFHLKEGETEAVLPFYFFKKTGIWGWGDGKNPKWTDDYSFVQNGLFFDDGRNQP